MRLELESGQVVEDATERDLRDLIAGEDFAILSSDPNTYIQCARTETQEYLLEYQDGALDRHFRATSSPIRLDDAVSALVKYLRNDRAWQSDFTWERVPLE